MVSLLKLQRASPVQGPIASDGEFCKQNIAVSRMARRRGCKKQDNPSVSHSRASSLCTREPFIGSPHNAIGVCGKRFSRYEN